jgi:hypothetical protein
MPVQIDQGILAMLETDHVSSFVSGMGAGIAFAIVAGIGGPATCVGGAMVSVAAMAITRKPSVRAFVGGAASGFATSAFIVLGLSGSPAVAPTAQPEARSLTQQYGACAKKGTHEAFQGRTASLLPGMTCK